MPPKKKDIFVPDYATGTRAAHFAWWTEQNLQHTIDRWVGEPYVLEDWQKRFMSEALATGGAGDESIWKSVALVLPRKNGKTTLLAAYALYDLLENDGAPEILLAAGSDKQAGRLFDQCAAFIQRNPKMREEVHVRAYIGEIQKIDSPGKILRMSSKGETLHGYNPSLVICDELHGWTTPRLQKAWTALTTAGGARARTQVFTISTAGEAHERTDGILGRLIDGNEERGEAEQIHKGLSVSRNPKGSTLVYNYQAPTNDRDDVFSFLLANPASWIGQEYLERQIHNAELRDYEILQLHGNVWSERTDSWLPANAWSKLAEPSIEVNAGSTVVLGFDGSYNGDSTALVGVLLDPEVDKPHIFLVDCWERPMGMRGEWQVPRREVKAAVLHWLSTYDVRELSCDPPGWVDTIEEWEETYGSPPVTVFHTNQTSQMAPASSRFYTAVINGELTHDGDPTLAKHVGNAVVKETTNGAVLVKDRRNSPRKIDAAVAAVVALDRASEVHTGDVGVTWA